MAFDRLQVGESTGPLESSGRLIGRGGTGRRATNSSAPCPDRTAARVAPRRFRPRSSRRDPSDCHDSPRIRCVSRRGTRSASYPGVDRRSASSRHRHQDPEPRHLDCPRYRQPRRPIAYRLEQSLNPLVVTNRQAWWVTSDISGKSYLLIQREEALVAQQFDVSTATLSGTPVPVANGVGSFASATSGLWSVARNGALVYRAGGTGLPQFTWLDPTGRVLGTVGDPGLYNAPAVSPDGTRLAFVAVDNAGNQDVWVRDLGSGGVTRLTCAS